MLRQFTASDVIGFVGYAFLSRRAAPGGPFFRARRHRASAYIYAEPYVCFTPGSGHAQCNGSPTITLGVYGHLFPRADDRVGQIIKATFKAASEHRAL